MHKLSAARSAFKENNSVIGNYNKVDLRTCEEVLIRLNMLPRVQTTQSTKRFLNFWHSLPANPTQANVIDQILSLSSLDPMCQNRLLHRQTTKSATTSFTNQYSHRPSINRRSKQLDQTQTLSLLRREDQLLIKGRIYKQRREQLAHIKKDAEINGCTFFPVTNSSVQGSFIVKSDTLKSISVLSHLRV